MKRVLLAVLAAGLVGSASAAPVVDAPVGFDFQGVSLVAILQATYKNLLHRDYVIAPEVLSQDKHVSMSVKALPLENVSSFVDGILAGQGIKVDKHEDGIYYLSALPSSGAVQDVSPVAAGAVVPKSPALAPGASPAAPELIGEQVAKVYRPMNRSVDFMVTVLNAAFGSNQVKPAGALVVVSAPEKRADAIVDLAEQLDLAPRNVEVSAAFIEVTASEGGSSGLSLVANVLGAKLGAVVGSGSGSLTVSKGGFSLVVDALAQDGRFKQVSNSRVVGDESERLSLSVGDETPTLQSSGRDNAGNAVQSIVYRSSGVILDVTPKLLGSGRLSLALDGQVSSFQATLTGVTGSPTLNKREVKTAVTLGDAEVLIVGGLEGNTVTDSTAGFSFLPRSWRSVVQSKNKSDLVLVLSARVLPGKGL